MRRIVLGFGLGLGLALMGCGGSGGSAGVNPRITVQWPERNRSAELTASVMANSVDIQFFRYRTEEPLFDGRFVVRRPFDIPSGATTSTATLQANMRPGLYTLGWATYNGDQGQGSIVNSSVHDVRIQSSGEITRPDGSPLIVRHKNKEPILSTRLSMVTEQIPVGQSFGLFFSVRYQGFGGVSETNESGAFFEFEWIEGRNLFDFNINYPAFLSYRALTPGIVRFRIKQDDYVSDIYQIEIVP